MKRTINASLVIAAVAVLVLWPSTATKSMASVPAVGNAAVAVTPALNIRGSTATARDIEPYVTPPVLATKCIIFCFCYHKKCVFLLGPGGLVQATLTPNSNDKEAEARFLRREYDAIRP